MLVLDENLPASQRLLLRKWHLRFRVVGIEVASAGTKDENLIPPLHRLDRPTLFTLDRHFFRRDWAHQRYCLVWLDVLDNEAAMFIRRLLRHQDFETQEQRMGKVVRVHAGGVQYWQVGRSTHHAATWQIE